MDRLHHGPNRPRREVARRYPTLRSAADHRRGRRVASLGRYRIRERSTTWWCEFPIRSSVPPMSDPGDPTPDPSPERAEERDSAPRHRHSKNEATSAMSRRRFFGWAAGGGGLVVVAAVAIAESTGPGQPHAAAARPPRSTTTSTTTTQPVLEQQTDVQGVSLPTSPAIIAENARTGDAWWVTTPQAAGDIEGYADRVSAQLGDVVTLRINTKATTFHVEAYRMGYYQGIGARRVWQSAEVAGVRQAPPALIAPTNTVECTWTPSIQFTIDATWPPGAYLLKLVGSTGEQGFVPLCVRDDSSGSAILVQQSVTTWQAYNRWGGYSLYYGNKGGSLSFTQNSAGGTYADRARIVSLDRPYSYDWASGSSDFIGNELPVIFQMEQLGLDVSYWTDIDLHERSGLLANHRALFSLGHDEYWSAAMRTGAETALRGGLNIAFLGANACYRQIRMEPSPLGPDRHVVCYKSAAEDPLNGKDNAQVTVNWEQAPVSDPESSLTGGMYQDIDADADAVVFDPNSWALAGTGLVADQHLPRAVQGEFDRYVPGGVAPANVDIIIHSVIPNRHNNYSDVTWFTVVGGGGVLDTGNASWVGQLANAPLIPSNVLNGPVPGVTDHLLRIMVNVYSVLGTAPASITHPSTGNWRTAF